MSLLDLIAEQKKRTEEQLSRGGGFGVLSFWKPEAGDNKIRIMPQWKDGLGGQFWREVSQHWNVSEDQKGPILCPRETEDLDGDCPICDLVKVLKARKNDTEAKQYAKDIRAKKTYFLNVVVRKDPVYTVEDVAAFKQSRPDDECPFEVGDDKFQIYACPITVFDHLLGLMHSAGKDFTDLKEGHDVTIKKIPNKNPIKTRYEIYPDLNVTDTGLTKPNLPDLSQVGFVLDHNDMVELLSSGRGLDLLESGSKGASLPKGNAGSEESVDLEQRMMAELNA